MIHFIRNRRSTSTGISDPHHPKYAFISAYGRDETVARELESGAADYIVKPFLADGTGGAAPRRAATA